MTSRPTTEHLDELAHAVVADGFEAHRAALADVVSWARRHGLCLVIADVVADPAAPRPARARALGCLLVALSALVDDAPVLVAAGAAPAA